MRPSNTIVVFISDARLEVRALVREDREEPKEGGCCLQREDPQLWCFEHQNAVNGVGGGRRRGVGGGVGLYQHCQHLHSFYTLDLHLKRPTKINI